MTSDRMAMRACDQDRQQVVDRLRAALEDGRLKLEEYLERMALAYQAVTYADLAPLDADLPADGTRTPPRRAEAPAAARASAAAAGPAAGPAAAPAPWGGALASLPTTLKVLWTIWLTVVSINVVVWALVSGTGGHLAYPWPVWVAGPYGALLFAISAGVTQIRRGRRPLARSAAS
jgi:Domain of unknown function (DUF1707)